MSASREILCEKIKKLEEDLLRNQNVGQSTDSIQTELSALRRQLSALNEALTEGKSLLRG